MNPIESMNTLIEANESVASLGLEHVKKYFESQGKDLTDKERVELLNAAMEGLKANSVTARMWASRANYAGVAAMVARMIGVNGINLVPLWNSITGASGDVMIEHGSAAGIDASKADSDAQKAIADGNKRNTAETARGKRIK
jgi:hypothetical protein